jgi:hypothetical protein
MTAMITRVINVDLAAGDGSRACAAGSAAGFAGHKRAAEHVRVRPGVCPG